MDEKSFFELLRCASVAASEYVESRNIPHINKEHILIVSGNGPLVKSFKKYGKKVNIGIYEFDNHRIIKLVKGYAIDIVFSIYSISDYRNSYHVLNRIKHVLSQEDNTIKLIKRRQ